MNIGKNTSSLVAILGRNHPDINSMLVQKGMSTVGEKIADSSNNRTILIERDQIMDQFTPEESFEAIVDKIAILGTTRKEEVENVLIATGSPKAIRSMSRKNFNAELQNRLTDNSEQGDKLRTFISVMIANDFGKFLVEDGFFTVRNEPKAGASDIGTLPTLPVTNVDTTVPLGGTIMPFVQTPDGGVKPTKSEKDWGSIFSGSAQILNSVGGILGLFVGGNQGTGNQNIFNDKTQAEIDAERAQYDLQRKSRNTKIIIGVVVAILLVVAIVVVAKTIKKTKTKS